MQGLTSKLRGIFVHTFFRDPARPLEWLNLLALFGWAQFFLVTPDVFQRPSFSGFMGLPQSGWALVMIAVGLTQLIAMWPIVKGAATLRFFAMAVAGGLWTIFAVSFGQGDMISSATRTYGSIAIVTGLAGVYLGWTSSTPR